SPRGITSCSSWMRRPTKAWRGNAWRGDAIACWKRCRRARLRRAELRSSPSQNRLDAIPNVVSRAPESSSPPPTGGSARRCRALLFQGFEIAENRLDAIADLASLALEAIELVGVRVILFRDLRLRFVGALSERVALAAQFLNRGDGALHALVELREDLAFFRS